MPSHETSVRAQFEKWVTAMEPAYADSNLERLTGGRGGYRVHNVACWWMAWQAAYVAGMARMREDAKHEALEELRKMSLEEFLAFALPAAPGAEGE